MIFIDTSAVIAMIAAEPDGPLLAAKLQREDECISAGHVILEASMRLATLLRLTPTADALVRRLFREAGAAIVPISEEIAHTSVIAFERYGKGRNRAALNTADCLSYACAKVHGARLLFKGGDFAHTDICQGLMAAEGLSRCRGGKFAAPCESRLRAAAVGFQAEKALSKKPRKINT